MPDTSTDKNIPVTQGSTYCDTVTVSYQDGTPFDLTGCAVASQLRDASGRLIGTFACSLLAPADGVIYRELPPADTAKLTSVSPKYYAWGVRVTLPDGKVLPEFQGGVNVTKRVVS